MFWKIEALKTIVDLMNKGMDRCDTKDESCEFVYVDRFIEGDTRMHNLTKLYIFKKSDGEVIKIESTSEALAHLKLLDILMEQGCISYEGIKNDY